ncbi:MAG: response regulator, partial [Spirochaetales bacterium]|nr:response regulator [Spirochaetales bacterium]
VDEAEHTVFSGAEAKIENLIMNMAINASHAMPTGGLLTIRTKNTFLDEYYCSQSPFNIKAGRYIEMQIRDTGSGIDPEILDRIFEPFFTTKKTGKGTGLGLSSVFGTVQEHNGAISVYSEPGTGTVFHVYLPCEEKEMENNSETRDLTWSGDAVVLLVDDEEIIRKTATMILNEMGMTVLTAVDGMDALKVFRDNNIDLVITDMIMPRMGGRELVCELRKLSPGLKIVVSSGFTKEDDLEELKHQGINSFIQKPFTMDELALLMKDIFS